MTKSGLHYRLRGLEVEGGVLKVNGKTSVTSVQSKNSFKGTIK